MSSGRQGAGDRPAGPGLGGRFEVFHERSERTGRRLEPLPVGPIRWRLLAGNRRSLGTSGSEHVDVEGAVGQLGRLMAGTERARTRLLAAEGNGGQWRWELELDGELVARSSRTYLRRIECELAADQFLRLAAGASVAPEVRSFRQSAGAAS